MVNNIDGSKTHLANALTAEVPKPPQGTITSVEPPEPPRGLDRYYNKFHVGLQITGAKAVSPVERARGSSDTGAGSLHVGGVGLELILGGHFPLNYNWDLHAQISGGIVLPPEVESGKGNEDRTSVTPRFRGQLAGLYKLANGKLGVGPYLAGGTIGRSRLGNIKWVSGSPAPSMVPAAFAGALLQVGREDTGFFFMMHAGVMKGFGKIEILSPALEFQKSATPGLGIEIGVSLNIPIPPEIF